MAIKNTNTAIEFSPEFFNLFKSLTYSRCVLGKSLVFRKIDDKIVCGRFDEYSKNVFFYMIFDEYTFRFPGDTITFNDFSVFLDACKRQGYGSNQSFKVRRNTDKKGFDVTDIYNSDSSMSYRLYNANAYPDDMGFLEEVDLTALDPEMFSFNITRETIDNINEICTSRHFECETFSFSKKSDLIVMCFNGPNDLDYKIKLKKDEVTNFDNINIGEEIKFSYSCFQMMNQIGTDYKISILNQDDNFNILCSAEITKENQIINSILFAPSRISND